MRVLHLIARLNDGGPARVIAALARTLPAHGITVEVAAGRCAADELDLAPRLRADGLDLTEIRELGRAPSVWSDVQALRRVMDLIRRRRPDVVHTHTAKAGALGRVVCRLLGVPCVHTYHGHVLDGYFGHATNLALHLGERLLAGDCHHHALTATQARDLAIGHAIGRRNRWHVLPIPVAAVTPLQAEWQRALKPDVPVIGFLGRLVAVKDVDLWLAALAVLAAGRPVQGVVCGDGQERARLEALVRQRGLPVQFTGTVPAGEAFQAMDVLLMTSRNEGLPLVAVEAAGCGIPVVAPAVGGLSDLIGAGAVRGADRTAPALASVCAQVLDHSAGTAALVQRGHALARLLAPERVAGRYAQLYAGISAQAPRRVH